ncbi:MAG: OmpA family protein [Flavobacterium sp.]
MKKIITSLFIFSVLSLMAQETTVGSDEYNRWSIELGAGQAKGIKPYAEGYFGSNPNKVLGDVMLNHYGLGVRYMFSPKFGLMLDGGYSTLKEFGSTESLPFELRNIRVGFQGVINAARLFNIQDKLGRFGMLFHGGAQVAHMTPQMGPNEGRNEWNGGIMFGFTPELRLTKNIALTADFTMISNIRQHFNWDGSYSDSNNNLSGSMYTTTLGLSFSFGSEKIHGDFAILTDKTLQELQALEQRVAKIETDMVDSDMDGVPDYLDAEPNSIAGVAVDSRGRMIDLNGNGVPDELERYLERTYATKESISGSDKEMIKDLINDGYVAAYFDFNKSQPTNASTEGIDFILTYLRNNPEANVEIYGNSDEIGRTAYNDELALKRANNVKDILAKAGIAESRMKVVGRGEDKSVDPTSESARRLVRKVTFKVNK